MCRRGFPHRGRHVIHPRKTLTGGGERLRRLVHAGDRRRGPCGNPVFGWLLGVSRPHHSYKQDSSGDHRTKDWHVRLPPKQLWQKPARKRSAYSSVIIAMSPVLRPRPATHEGAGDTRCLPKMLCDHGAINAAAAASMLRMDPMPLATRGFCRLEKVRVGGFLYVTRSQHNLSSR